tara:strand:+ start:3997 stop:4173 length:177 start_codon:yes stop_codon:yes gene_type:complete
MGNPDEGINEVLERIKKEDIKFVELQFTDIDGMIKSAELPESKLEEALEKVNGLMAVP